MVSCFSVCAHVRRLGQTELYTRSNGPDSAETGTQLQPLTNFGLTTTAFHGSVRLSWFLLPISCSRECKTCSSKISSSHWRSLKLIWQVSSHLDKPKADTITKTIQCIFLRRATESDTWYENHVQTVVECYQRTWHLQKESFSKACFERRQQRWYLSPQPYRRSFRNLSLKFTLLQKTCSKACENNVTQRDTHYSKTVAKQFKKISLVGTLSCEACTTFKFRGQLIATNYMS